MQNQFLELNAQQEKILHKEKQTFQQVGTFKLVLFLLFAFIIYQIYRQGNSPLLFIIAVSLLAVQIYLWIYHERIQERIRHAKGMIVLNKKNIARIDGNWKHFDDIGEEYLNVDHSYGNDLDVVGRKSLFQHLNTTNTWYGRQTFAYAMLHSDYSYEEIEKRQGGICELSQDITFLNEVWYHLSKIGTNPTTPEFVKELNTPQLKIKSKLLPTVLTYLPIVTIIILLGTQLFQMLHSYRFIGISLLILQGLIWLFGVPFIHKYLSSASSLPYGFEPYCKVIELIEKQPFQSEKLIDIRDTIIKSEVSAKKGIQELGKIANRLGARKNSILYFILNLGLLWDYECIFLLENWKRIYGPHCEQWFLSLGEFESLTCFANMPNVVSNVCMPVKSEKKEVFAQDIGHPLLPNDVRVTNEVNLCDNIFVISGSNMSGKTTYLRTIGINLVLANAGGFTCAKRMKFSKFKLKTSMRIADDLNEGISTFYAELKRIKNIIESAKENPDTLFLIDEIFRGTNSVDRLSGAKTVISKLNSYGVTGMITTHDLELCNLELDSNRVKNYSFQEYYKKNEIFFDYKLTKGRSQTTNAKYLMELLGIL